MIKFKAVFIAVTALLCLPGFAAAENLQSRLFAVQDGRILLQAAARPVDTPALFTADRPGSLVMSESRPERDISRSGAMLRSLLIPGWGESYLGYHGTARAFFWTDVALWASVIGFEVYSQWKEDQFIAFAATHASVQMAGKPEQFYVDISNYTNTEAYNEAKLRNRDFDAVYTDPAYFWAWASDQNRLDYDHMRIQSRSAHNKIYLFIGAAALNRLISFIDASKKARDVLKRKESRKLGFHIQPGSVGSSNSLRLVVSADL